MTLTHRPHSRRSTLSGREFAVLPGVQPSFPDEIKDFRRDDVGSYVLNKRPFRCAVDNHPGTIEWVWIRLIGSIVVSVEERLCQVSAKPDGDGILFAQTGAPLFRQFVGDAEEQAIA